MTEVRNTNLDGELFSGKRLAEIKAFFPLPPIICSFLPKDDICIGVNVS